MMKSWGSKRDQKNGLLVLTVAGVLSASFARADIVLINHVFDDGTGTLNGTLVDGGTLQTGALSWFAEANTDITADGVLSSTVAGSLAYIDLGSAIQAGNIYEMEVAIDNSGTGVFIAAGFLDDTTVNHDSNHEFNQGTAWFLWRANGTAGRIEPSTGLQYTKTVDFPSGDEFVSTTGGFETFTVRLDLRVGNGAMSIFHNGTQLYAADSPAAFDGSEDFAAVGISARGVTEGVFQSLTLTQVVIPEPSTLALMGLGFGALLMHRRRMA